MKTIFTIVMLLLAMNSFSQISVEILDHNQTSAMISNEGTVFHDFNGSSPGYEVPGGSGMTAIRSLQFWFAGKDSLGNIRTALGGYPNQGRDVFPGPYSYYHNYDTTYQAHWGDGMWSICQWQIDQYRLWWECENGLAPPPECANAETPNNSTLEAIFNWPAHGSPANGEDFYEAPFWDRDNDGIYDPVSGDVPMIKGCCATYMIQNDDAGVHTYSGTEPLGIEVHYMFYHYRAWSYLDTTTFVEVKVKNTGENDYTDFTYGIMTDANLGDPADNYFGADSLTNMMYFYNRDNDDAVYGMNPPAIGIVALDTVAHAIRDYESFQSPAEAWNIMKGLNALGQPILHPNGYQTTYEYSDDPNVPNGWSGQVVGTQLEPNRGIMTTNGGVLNGVGIFGLWIPEEKVQTYAVIYNRSGDHLQNAQGLIQTAQAVQQFQDTINNISCDGMWLEVEEKMLDDITIRPNPTEGIFHVDLGKYSTGSVELLDLNGMIVLREEFGSSMITMDISSRTRGAYLLKIVSDSGIVVKRLILE